MAHTRQELRIDPNGKDTTNTINRAGLVGEVSWLEEIMREELATGSTFKLLTDSQVTLQSIQKAIKQPATTWLNTHEPVLMDIVKRIKDLTEGGHHVHIGKVKAHMGVEGNIKADLAAKKVAIQKIIDSGVDRNDVSERDLDEAGIDSTCSVSSNAHEGREWPVHPAPGSTEFNEKYLSGVEKMLQEGHWPDGPPPIPQQGSDGRAAGHVPSRAAVREDEDWQVRNLHASVSNAVESTSRLGYSNGASIYVKLWRNVAPLLLPGTSHMFWEQFTQSRRKVKTTAVRNAIQLRYGTF